MTRILALLLALLCPTMAVANETPYPRASTGAAPGYLEDQVCAGCHADKHASYQQVGMARSFARPSASVFIEDFVNNHFYHAPSQRHYEMVRNGDDLLFRRYQLDDDGKPINLFEVKVDWILGSGNRARSYLYQTVAGELYQLPLGWYSQGRHWGMSPGFDQPNHLGVTRRVPHECMFCHNAYPEVPVGSDQRWQPVAFPHQLPEGTGCQRCHGPGQAHVAEVMKGTGDLAAIRAAIVNPGRMPATEQIQVCEQCHMLPAVAMIGVRRFDRPVYSHRPDQPLTDYMLPVDIDELSSTKVDRFEINHAPYRLKQSRCFIQSPHKLTCLNCHDPHRKIARPERAAHYRKACLQCHEPHGTVDSAIAAAPDDCVTCHMPQRRTRDVIQVTMTDHRIQRIPPGPERLAPLQETVPTITGIEFVYHEQAPKGPLGEIYKAVTVLRAQPSADAIDWLEKQLALAPQSSLEPYLELANAQIKTQRVAAAKNTLSMLLERNPDNAQALSWMGVVMLLNSNASEAEDYQRRAVAVSPGLAEAHYQLGLALLAQNRHQDALAAFDQAIALSPVMSRAWFKRGDALDQLGQTSAAIESFQRALTVSPNFDRAYLRLAQTLVKSGDTLQAIRYLKHGLRVAEKLPAMKQLLLELAPPPIPGGSGPAG